MTKFTGIKAVSFDVDGTLWDFDAVMRNGLRETLLELATRDPQAAAMLDVDTLIAIRDRVHDELRDVVVDLNEIRNEGFKQALMDAGRPDDDLAMHLSNVYFKHRWANMELFDDAHPTLEALAQRYAIGIISNGNAYPSDLGLEGIVEFAVFSQDHSGIEKPDPRIFRIALEKAGTTASELVHVGDSLENDVTGAATAGIKSVWLNRNGDQSHQGIRPDREIASLRELPAII